MQELRQAWDGLGSMHWWKVTRSRRLLSACQAARFFAILGLTVVPMHIASMTVNTKVEAAENSPAVAEASVSVEVLTEYRLAPGDRLKIVVLDQEQLSGEFTVDGIGGILLPIIGQVGVAGQSLAEAQQLIQDRLADGVLVHPAVSARITEYRPIFVTGDVRKPGSYPFLFGGSVKAAIAAAGGEGPPTEQSLRVAISEFLMAEERVRQLEMNLLGLNLRKARLEAQRDERGNFVMPQLVGFNSDTTNSDFQLIYASENDTFLRLEDTYSDQLKILQRQHTRIEAETTPVTDEIATEEGHLGIVNERLADLEGLFAKGLLRKDVLINQRIEKALVKAGLSRLEGQVAQLRRIAGEVDVKIEETKATYKRQILGELQETAQRLREIAAAIGTARKLRDIKAEYANISSDEPDYAILISRPSADGVVTFNATKDTILRPGDVIEVKLKPRREPGDLSLPIEAAASIKNLIPHSSLAASSTSSPR